MNEKPITLPLSLDRTVTLYPSQCGHPQTAPSNFEIDNCPEIIVRVCMVCRKELWWYVDQWKKIV